MTLWEVGDLFNTYWAWLKWIQQHPCVSPRHKVGSDWIKDIKERGCFTKDRGYKWCCCHGVSRMLGSLIACKASQDLSVLPTSPPSPGSRHSDPFTIPPESASHDTPGPYQLLFSLIGRLSPPGHQLPCSLTSFRFDSNVNSSMKFSLTMRCFELLTS